VKGPRLPAKGGGNAEDDFLAGFERRDGSTGSTAIGDEDNVSSIVEEIEVERWWERLVGDRSDGRGGRGAVGAGKVGAARVLRRSWTPLTVLRLEKNVH